MSITPLYEFDDHYRQLIVRSHLEMRQGGTVTGPIEGTYGEIYSVLSPQNTFPRRIAAKCPRIKRFGSFEKAQVGIEQVLHELEKTHQAFMVPWINRFFDVQIIHGWPFLLSRYRDGSLEDLIANPFAWSTQDRFASLIQIVRALRLIQRRGIVAHQDLKPGNVFFDDLSQKFNLSKDSKGMHFRMFVADFGLADAFRDFGRNTGSRPYMAPEQFSSVPIDPTTPALFDVFALGVIAFECLGNGLHPIGVVTADVWPRRHGMGQKWNRESTWRDWAQTERKKLPPTSEPVPKGMEDLIAAALSVEPKKRPSLEEFECRLWEALMQYDPETHQGLKMQVEWIEGLSSGDTEWPHMDDRLMELRTFYSLRPMRSGD
jgi:serine/threonine protein kinase